MAGRAERLKVVFDASSLVSAILKVDSVPARALRRAMEPPNRLLLSPDIVAEYREVLFRPKFDRFVSVSRRQRVLDVVIVAADMIETVPRVLACADPKDDKYLAVAAGAGADVLVSSDVHHLLSMHPWRGIPILLPADFLALLDEPPRDPP